MKKTIVLDTNVPMLDALCVHNFEENDIVLPSVMIKELNNNKSKRGEAGKNARDFANYIDSLGSEIYDGVLLPTGGTLKILPPNLDVAREIQEVFLELEKDELIIATAIVLHRQYENQKSFLEQLIKDSVVDSEREKAEQQLAELKPVVLVSRDTNVRIKAKKFGIIAETYLSDSIHTVSLYDGNLVVNVSDELLNAYYMQVNRYGGSDQENFEVFHPELKEIALDYKLNQNQYLILAPADFVHTPENLEELYRDVNTPILKHIRKGRDGNSSIFLGLITLRSLLSRYSVFPRNTHQVIIIDLVADTSIVQKSIVGTAGSGKTLFALLVSLILTNDLGIFDEIIVTRPPVEAEYEIGFLPGNEQEKMEPYLRGFKNNLKFILSQLDKGKYKSVKKEKLEKAKPFNKTNPNGSAEKEEDELAFSKFNIKPESMGFMRGETTYRQIMIVDESQNSTSKAMKTTLTRIGDESMVIILGDITQIDYHLVDATSNGLTHAVELMKDDDLSGHITLAIGERSELSKRISERWDKFVSSKN